jgi:hypothetical protein
MAKAKENNFLVSGTGGAGTNGQPARYAAGIDNAQDFYELQTSQPMAGENTANKPSYAAQGAMPKISLDGIVPLDAPTQYPEEGVDTGGALGPNAGAKVAESPRASNATRNWYRYIRSQVEGLE